MSVIVYGFMCVRVRGLFFFVYNSSYCYCAWRCWHPAKLGVLSSLFGWVDEWMSRWIITHMYTGGGRSSGVVYTPTGGCGRPLHEHYTDHYSERDKETDVIHNVTGISTYGN